MGWWKDVVAYHQDNPQGYWFKSKLYGWGWTPVRWQGWAVIALYVLGIVGFAMTIDDGSPPREVVFTFLLPVALLTIVLFRICYRFGEKPRWMWGPPKK